jgi:hypothetical protein
MLGAAQAVAGFVAAAAIGGGSLVAAATGSGSEPARAADRTVPCGAVWERLPEDLRGDLRALEDMSPAERAGAVRQIREDARAGDYGSRVQQFAERRDERRDRIRSHLPDELRDDLEAALEAEDGDRRDALLAVREAALSGEYGDRVQRAAERRQEHRETCRPGVSG